jgi:hypothetical protein
MKTENCEEKKGWEIVSYEVKESYVNPETVQHGSLAVICLGGAGALMISSVSAPLTCAALGYVGTRSLIMLISSIREISNRALIYYEPEE